ncbi:uncharacterized protein [Nicotiana tomentosiformis]|uniref:uncharacterized protein n=1 Tax=Nicotiana tomentosiformis TaxID=4098 RepID=UPI00388C8CE3
MGRFVRVRALDLIPAEDMPFLEKWNMKPVAQMSDPITKLKKWVEGLVSQRSYSERAWMELSKGRLEAHNHGLKKDVAMWPPFGDEEVFPHPPAPRQAKEKKRRDALNSIRRLRDKSEEEEEDNSKLVARVWADVTVQEVLEPASAEVEASRHEEAFLRYREELTHHEAEAWDLIEKSDTYKLLSEKLQDDLVTAWDEHGEMSEQVRQRLEQIKKLQKQVDTIQAKAEEFKNNMDILASKRETVLAQLESAETQLQAAKEKAKANLASELEVARSEVAVANTKADAKVAQFKVDVEAIQATAKSMVYHAKWQARRESLEGVHAQGFDVMAEIEKAKAEETRGQKLAFHEEDSDGLSAFEYGEDPEDGDVTPDEDQAT